MRTMMMMMMMMKMMMIIMMMNVMVLYQLLYRRPGVVLRSGRNSGPLDS